MRALAALLPLFLGCNAATPDGPARAVGIDPAPAATAPQGAPSGTPSSGAPANGSCGGLAARYLGDHGIAGDPDVVFAEDFEASQLETVLAPERWSSFASSSGMALVEDAPAGSAGHRSMRMTQVSGAPDLFKHLPDSDVLFVRYYVKYAAGGTYHHAGGWIGGFNPGGDWPRGFAGYIPDGTDLFAVGPELADGTNRFDLYTYWMHMRPQYGNYFVDDPAVRVEPDRWTAVEVMVKMNDPVSAYNGELRLWLDGREIIHLAEGAPHGTWSGGRFTPDASGEPFEGFQWRSDPALALNYLWLNVYMPEEPSGVVWFDDVVVARRYIGPLNASGSACP